MNIIVAILILGIIVIVHELGHFLLAKKNGITVTEFSVGMGPRIASFVHKGTRYSLKVLPFGGSCMMLGEDDTVDDEGAFHKKGAWARFSVIFAGAFFNFVFAFILALVYLGNAGVDKPYVHIETKDSSSTDSSSADTSSTDTLIEGDYITKINGSPIHFARDIYYYFYFNPISEKPITIDYIRAGEKSTTTIQPKTNARYMLGCDYSRETGNAKLTMIADNYPLAKAGLAVGDIIVNINGTEIKSGKDLEQYLKDNPLTDKQVSLIYTKENSPENRITIDITPKYVKSYYMDWGYSISPEKVSALEVIKYSFYELKLNIVNTLKSVLYLVTGKVSVKEIAGPVGIVNAVGSMINQTVTIKDKILNLIAFSILISANLGVMNLLPLPALDGGRLVFILIEAIRRKPVPKEREAMVHMVGMVLLMMLMVFVMYNDFRNIFS
ncbi:MAG TPA: RIP metalloprotease RseP [Mobilitalea sp.]|nr:RIP metalloprotease RseP [Mobilitalea sp.]